MNTFRRMGNNSLTPNWPLTRTLKIKPIKEQNLEVKTKKEYIFIQIDKTEHTRQRNIESEILQAMGTEMQKAASFRAPLRPSFPSLLKMVLNECEREEEDRLLKPSKGQPK